MFDARCCAKTCASRRGHVTCLRFETEVLSCWAVGRGAETRVSGRVSTWGVVPSPGWCVVGPWVRVARCWGWWWVPGGRRGRSGWLSCTYLPCSPNPISISISLAPRSHSVTPGAASSHASGSLLARSGSA
jgi:hypothetical protein